MSRVKPHYHVDMWSEMKKIKELTLKQFENDVVKYLDEMKSMKLLSRREGSHGVHRQSVRERFVVAVEDCACQYICIGIRTNGNKMVTWEGDYHVDQSLA